MGTFWASVRNPHATRLQAPGLNADPINERIFANLKRILAGRTQDRHRACCKPGFLDKSASSPHTACARSYCLNSKKPFACAERLQSGQARKASNSHAGLQCGSWRLECSACRPAFARPTRQKHSQQKNAAKAAFCLNRVCLEPHPGRQARPTACRVIPPWPWRAGLAGTWPAFAAVIAGPPGA